MRKGWKIISATPILESEWLSVEDRTYELPNGKHGEHYYFFKKPNYVLVVAVDQNKNLIIEKNYRPGADEFIYEFPQGMIEENENLTSTAIREVLEETGYTIYNPSVCQPIYVQASSSSLTGFVVTALFDSTKRSPRHLSHDENIEVELLSLKDIQKRVNKGLIKDMGSLAALAIYKSLEAK
ncbi:NUDIX hydrolase [Candidatus Gottesmanbacteria bacterium]|nr:NUDIX hydrolase [Candidatus Gottesmanbacteria bacterium]